MYEIRDMNMGARGLKTFARQQPRARNFLGFNETCTEISTSGYKGYDQCNHDCSTFIGSCLNFLHQLGNTTFADTNKVNPMSAATTKNGSKAKA